MDGVLVDVSQSYRLAIKKTAEFFINKTISEKTIQEVKNKPGFNNDWNATAEIIREAGKRLPQKKVIEKFQEFYLGKDFDGLIKNEIWLLKKEVVASISKEYRLGIVTGRPRIEAEYALKASGQEEYFDVLITMDDLEAEKPNPLLLKVALQQLECKEGYYFGDVADDMTMANNANVIAIGVLPPKADKGLKDLLKDAGASYILEDINKLKEVLT